MKKMKAQASLEMVVGLIILLVVAAVVISLILYFINPQKMPDPGTTLSVREFNNRCTDYCNDINSLDYCKYYYPGTDWNKNGLKNEIVRVGKYEWPACEDRIYCFLVVPCEDRFGMGIDASKKCRDLLCQTYKEKYGGVVLDATSALNDDVNFSPNCDEITFTSSVGIGKDNWYKEVFEAGCS
jgi:hypothetical protein